MSMISWIKNNKLLTFLLIVVAIFLFNSARSYLGVNLLRQSISSPKMGAVDYEADLYSGAPAESGLSRTNYLPSPEYTPQTDVEDRLVIQESNLSLLVTDVIDVRDKIVDYAKNNGGYMVSSKISNPQDAPTATVVIRISSDKLDDALDYFHSLSVKVVSENLSGKDVADQYVDIDKRIETYEKTKARFEAILDQATKIDDITRLTREIINIQSQIDSLKGQQESLEQKAALSKLTIYLATDELALPYAPSETFRPRVIFKLAVRSLIGFARSLATYAIWIGVYSVVWVPALAIFIAVKRWRKKSVN